MLPSDADAIAALSHQLGYPASPGEAGRRIGALLEHPDHCVFVVQSDAQVIGWIHGFYTINLESDPFVAIAGLVVHENHRRQGVGKLLIDAVASWSASRNCGRVRVRCNAKRTEAHRFYEALGFREVKQQKIFDRRVGV
jgi:GNAT superfamily N-acetyltransferase